MIPAPSRQLEPQEADDEVTTGVQFRYGTMIRWLLRLGWALRPAAPFRFPSHITVEGLLAGGTPRGVPPPPGGPKFRASMGFFFKSTHGHTNFVRGAFCLP